MKNSDSVEAANNFSIKEVCKTNNLYLNLRQVVESHPNESAKNLGMSILHLLNNERDKMLECLKFLEQKHPHLTLISHRLAEIYIDKSEYATAIIYLEKVLKEDKENLTAKIWLSLSYYATGDEKKAKVFFDFLKEDVFLLSASNNNWSGK